MIPLFTNEHHWEAVAYEAGWVKEAWVSTFGLGYSNEAVTILQAIPKTTMIVGVPSVQTPEDQGMADAVVVHYLKCCPGLTIRRLAENHLKVWLFKNMKGRFSAIVGGRNVTNSKWHDLSIKIADQRACKAIHCRMMMMMENASEATQCLLNQSRDWLDDIRSMVDGSLPLPPGKEPTTCPQCGGGLVRSQQLGKGKKPYKCTGKCRKVWVTTQ